MALSICSICSLLRAGPLYFWVERYFISDLGREILEHLFLGAPYHAVLTQELGKLLGVGRTIGCGYVPPPIPDLSGTAIAVQILHAECPALAAPASQNRVQFTGAVRHRRAGEPDEIACLGRQTLDGLTDRGVPATENSGGAFRLGVLEIVNLVADDECAAVVQFLPPVSDDGIGHDDPLGLAGGLAGFDTLENLGPASGPIRDLGSPVRGDCLRTAYVDVGAITEARRSDCLHRLAEPHIVADHAMLGLEDIAHTRLLKREELHAPMCPECLDLIGHHRVVGEFRRVARLDLVIQFFEERNDFGRGIFHQGLNLSCIVGPPDLILWAPSPLVRLGQGALTERSGPLEPGERGVSCNYCHEVGPSYVVGGIA